MTPALAWTFWILAASTFVGVPLYALRVRGRTYAIFGLVVLAIVLVVDLVARFSREKEDPQDACGFYEWLWNRNTSVATNSRHGVDGPGRVWLPGDPSRERPEPNDPVGGPPQT